MDSSAPPASTTHPPLDVASPPPAPTIRQLALPPSSYFTPTSRPADAPTQDVTNPPNTPKIPLLPRPPSPPPLVLPPSIQSTDSSWNILLFVRRRIYRSSSTTIFFIFPMKNILLFVLLDEVKSTSPWFTASSLSRFVCPVLVRIFNLYKLLRTVLCSYPFAWASFLPACTLFSSVDTSPRHLPHGFSEQHG